MIVGIVALPLAIAFAIASGVPPERGLFTAIVGGFLISALGGSRVQIGGPTGAFVVIVYAIVQKHGVEGLGVATLMAGLMLVGFGVARLGGAIKFIPYPVIIGFTSGIAVIIFSSEVKDLVGLRMGRLPADFLAKWRTMVVHFDTINPWAVLVSAADSDVHAQPVIALERSGLYDELGEENVHGNIDDALNRAREYLGLPQLPRPAFATPTVAREKDKGSSG